MELLKQGFLYSNIEVLEKYDPDKKAGVIIEQVPAKGTSVISNIDQIDRGYEDIEIRLNALGARITRNI